MTAKDSATGLSEYKGRPGAERDTFYPIKTFVITRAGQHWVDVETCFDVLPVIFEQDPGVD